MKKELIDEKHCHYCKRHCSLSNPHCSKGKTLAKEKKLAKEKILAKVKKKEGNKRERKKQEGNKQEWKVTEENLRILGLFQKCYNTFPSKKNMRLEKKKKKYILLTTLLEKGDMSKKELKEYTKMSSSNMDKTLLKLMKKGYICWKKDDKKEKYVSATNKAMQVWKSYMEKRNEEYSIFSVLEKEEKEYLENILKKLSAEWKRK